MPSNLTDVDAFTTVTGPDGGDIRNAASVRSALQTLANRTRYLFNRFVDPSINGFRLTGTTGNPVTDTATPSTIYLTPYVSNRISIYDGTSWQSRSSAEVSLVLSGLIANNNYDVFAQWNGSAVVLALTSWTNDSTRATALARQDGVWVKSGTATDRYVGTIRTISTTQTADSATRRYVWNVSNRLIRNLFVTDGTAGWNYVNPNGVWRQARAQTANKVEIVTGLAESMLDVVVSCEVSAASYTAAVGVGLNSTTVNSAQIFGEMIPNRTRTKAFYQGRQSVGYTAVNWLEVGDSAVATFTFGSGGAAQPNGLIGTIEG